MTIVKRAGTALLALTCLVWLPSAAQTTHPAGPAEPPRLMRSVVLPPPVVPGGLGNPPAAPEPAPTSPRTSASPSPPTPPSALSPEASPPPATTAVVTPPPAPAAPAPAAVPGSAPAMTPLATPVPPGVPTPAAALPAPASNAGPGSTERKPASLDIEIPGNIVGPTRDSLKRNLGAVVASPGAAPQALRSLKRLSREEILIATSDVLAIYVLRDNERTLVLDFPTVREQARMFVRLILFIERAGSSKTRVMSVPEVQKWLSQNSVQLEGLTVGNNMRTGELARFFNSARFQGEPITVDEQRLYDWLVQFQLLREEESGVAVVDPERILVSVPQASGVPGCSGCGITPAQRAVILSHELSHARYTTDTVYQNYVVWFWSNAMSLVVRDKWTRFLRSRGYDAGIRELAANEMQAFLMHTPDPTIFSATDVGMTDAELADLRRRFQEGLTARPRAAADRTYQFE